MEPINIEKIADEIEQRGMRKWLIEEFAHSFREARKNKLGTFNEHSYDVCWDENILKLVNAVLERYYEPSPSISFVVFDPMVREIFAAPFVDRIVHHFLYNMNGGWWDRRFIDDSYSCRVGRGTHYGVRRVHEMMKRASRNFTQPAMIIKLDIKGYFMSMPREKLYERVVWGLEQQFRPYFDRSVVYDLYQICKYLWRQILLDNPIVKSRRRGPVQHWEVLPVEKSLYMQRYGLGIVIGNLTSQLVSNIYLDQLDRYIKIILGYKYYGRYVDDFIIVVPKEQFEQAKEDIEKIRVFLKDKLELTLHPKKCYIQSVYNGVQFLGTRIYPHCLYPSNRLQQKFKTTLYNTVAGKAAMETTISYFGFLKHMDADGFVKQMFDKYGIDYALYLESKSCFRRSWEKIVGDMRR